MLISKLNLLQVYIGDGKPFRTFNDTAYCSMPTIDLLPLTYMFRIKHTEFGALPGFRHSLGVMRHILKEGGQLYSYNGILHPGKNELHTIQMTHKHDMLKIKWIPNNMFCSKTGKANLLL